MNLILSHIIGLKEKEQEVVEVSLTLVKEHVVKHCIEIEISCFQNYLYCIE